MIKAICSIALLSALSAGSLCSQGLAGQISQIHPELCGEPGTTVPLPPNISASFDISNGSAQLLFLRNNAVEKRLDLDGVVNQIDEVCPVSNQRLLIFASNYAGDVVFIVDQAKSAMMDTIWCFQPTISPNQRWLAYREFHSLHTINPASAEYLLYDLQRTPGQNRPVGVSLKERLLVGRTVFPKELNNAPLDHMAAPAGRLHEQASAGFFWSQDSRVLIFGDSLQRHFSVVAVSITDAGQTEAKIHGVDIKDVCPSTTSPEDFALSIASADSEVTNTGDPLIKLNFTPNPGVCDPKPLEFNLSEFHDPPTETFVKPKMKKAVVDRSATSSNPHPVNSTWTRSDKVLLVN